MSEIEKYVETKVSIEYEQKTRESIVIKGEDKTNGGIITEIKTFKSQRSIKSRKYSSKSMISHDNDIINKKEDYQIAISQNGRFVATFDTGIISYLLFVLQYKMYIYTLTLYLHKIISKPSN